MGALVSVINTQHLALTRRAELLLKRKTQPDELFAFASQCFEAGAYQQTKELIVKALENTKEEEHQANDYAILGDCCFSLGDYKQATERYLKALDIGFYADDRTTQALTQNSLACSYMYLGNFHAAVETFHAICIEGVDEAIQKALQSDILEIIPILRKHLTNDEYADKIKTNNTLNLLKDLENRIKGDLEPKKPLIEEPETLESLRAQLKIALKRAEEAEATIERVWKVVDSIKAHRSKFKAALEPPEVDEEGQQNHITSTQLYRKSKDIFDKVEEGETFVIARKKSKFALRPFEESDEGKPHISLSTTSFRDNQPHYFDRMLEGESFAITRRGQTSAPTKSAILELIFKN